VRTVVPVVVFAVLLFAASASAHVRIAGAISGVVTTAVFKNVIVESSRTTDLRVKLTAGQITETVLGGGVL